MSRPAKRAAKPLRSGRIPSVIGGARDADQAHSLPMSTRFSRFALLIGTATLAACSRGGVEDPATVLERAAVNAQGLESAAFDVTFDYSVPEGFSARGTAEGVLAEGGRQLSFSVNASVTVPSEGLDKTVSVDGDVVVAGENEAYMRIRRADGSVPFLPGIGLVPPEMLDTWFSLGSGTASGSSSMTPDPSFVAMQVQVIRVTEDRSYEEVDGEDCYAYDVTIDRDKALAYLERTSQDRGQAFDRQATEEFLSLYDAKGTMWIDAETSVIRRISWTFDPAPDAVDAAGGSFTLHLEHHNDPVEISPPAGAVPFESFTPAASLDALPAL